MDPRYRGRFPCTLQDVARTPHALPRSVASLGSTRPIGVPPCRCPYLSPWCTLPPLPLGTRVRALGPPSACNWAAEQFGRFLFLLAIGPPLALCKFGKGCARQKLRASVTFEACQPVDPPSLPVLLLRNRGSLISQQDPTWCTDRNDGYRVAFERACNPPATSVSPSRPLTSLSIF
jgi:hypothetical protein